MHKLFATVILLFLTLPAVAATKATVDQLDTLLNDLYQQKKSDEATATRLKDIQLTEQLTTTRMNSFTRYAPGPLTTTQIRILAVDSSLLPPPPSDLPSDPTPDHQTQAAIMAKAVDYAAHQYASLPRLVADKQTIRFQNGVTQLRTDSSTTSNFASGDPSSDLVVNQYLHMLGAHTTTVQSENGIEAPPPIVKQKDPASQNGQISQGGAGLVLGIILIDAGKGEMSWLRWQTIDGKKTAVFAFSVNKSNRTTRSTIAVFPLWKTSAVQAQSVKAP